MIIPYLTGDPLAFVHSECKPESTSSAEVQLQRKARKGKRNNNINTGMVCVYILLKNKHFVSFHTSSDNNLTNQNQGRI